MGILRRLFGRPHEGIRDVYLFTSETGLRSTLVEKMGAAGVLDAPDTADDFFPSADKALGLNGALVRAIAGRGIRRKRVKGKMSTEEWHSFLARRFAHCARWRSWGASTPIAVHVIVVVFD